MECAAGTIDHDASPVSPCELCPVFSFNALARQVGACTLCPDSLNAWATGATSADNCTRLPSISDTSLVCTQLTCPDGYVPTSDVVMFGNLNTAYCCQVSCATWGASNCPAGSAFLTELAESTAIGEDPTLSCCSRTCPPGTTVSATGRCELCPAGTISTDNDASACTTCEAGKFATMGSSACTTCAVNWLSSLRIRCVCRFVDCTPQALLVTLLDAGLVFWLVQNQPRSCRIFPEPRLMGGFGESPPQGVCPCARQSR